MHNRNKNAAKRINFIYFCHIPYHYAFVFVFFISVCCERNVAVAFLTVAFLNCTISVKSKKNAKDLKTALIVQHKANTGNTQTLLWFKFKELHTCIVHLRNTQCVTV